MDIGIINKKTENQILSLYKEKYFEHSEYSNQNKTFNEL